MRASQSQSTGFQVGGGFFGDDNAAINCNTGFSVAGNFTGNRNVAANRIDIRDPGEPIISDVELIKRVEPLDNVLRDLESELNQLLDSRNNVEQLENGKKRLTEKFLKYAHPEASFLVRELLARLKLSGQLLEISDEGGVQSRSLLVLERAGPVGAFPFLCLAGYIKDLLDRTGLDES